MSNKIGNMRRELRNSVGRPVAYQIREGLGASLVPVLERVMRGDKVLDGEFYGAVVDDAPEKSATRDAIAKQLAGPMIIPAGKGGKSTALVSMRGMAMYDVEYQPMAFSTLLLSQTMAALGADPDIGLIILHIDSPGGVVTGTKEAADAVYKARQSKPVVALVNPLCASAAYWIASQASEIVAVPSADVGSVGVFMMHAECSKMLEMDGVKPTFIFAKDSPYKIEGNSFEPLSEEAEEYFQGEVDAIMTEFVKAISRGRGVPVSKVLADFGKGRTMLAPAAKTAGMVDRCAPLGQALGRWGIGGGVAEVRQRRGEDDTPDANAVAGYSITIGAGGAGGAGESADAWADMLAGAEFGDHTDIETPEEVVAWVDAQDGGEELAADIDDVADVSEEGARDVGANETANDDDNADDERTAQIDSANRRLAVKRRA